MLDLIKVIGNHLGDISITGYIIFQQIQRHYDLKKQLQQDSYDFVMLKAKNECKEKYEILKHNQDEIDRYAISKLKTLKKDIESSIETKSDLEQAALSGILLNAFVKAEKIFLYSLHNNGYHNLDPHDLEQYIQFQVSEFYDNDVNNIDNKWFEINIDKNIIISNIRDIITTSLSISRHLKE